MMDGGKELFKLDVDLDLGDVNCCNSSCIRTKTHKCCPAIYCFKFLKKKKKKGPDNNCTCDDYKKNKRSHSI
jgi:hypothetical protein